MMRAQNRPTLVLKFGGTSVANTERIQHVAQKVKAEIERGYKVVVVVSAMAGETNRLLEHIRRLTTAYDPQEYDVVLAAGEQASAGLLAIELQAKGIPARSWLGWQIPILTSCVHGHAVIQRIPTQDLMSSLDAGHVAVVAGFQGVSEDGRITTLGRGGSDTSAVALAAALKAERCDIYTDVEGVYTADPRLVSDAGCMDEIAYAEMLELASHGAKVLQRESVEYAMKHGVPLRVLSSMKDAPGTLIANTVQKTRDISGITHVSGKTLIRISLSDEVSRIDVEDWFRVQGVPSFYCAEEYTRQGHSLAVVVEPDHVSRIDKQFLVSIQKENIAIVSIVGSAIRNQQYIPLTLFYVIESAQIPNYGVNTSDIKVSFLLDDCHVKDALEVIHRSFNFEIRSRQGHGVSRKAS